MATTLAKEIAVLICPPRVKRPIVPGSVSRFANPPKGEEYDDPEVVNEAGAYLVGTNNEDKPSVLTSDVPIYLPNVLSVSRTLGLNSIGTASVHLTGLNRGVLFEEAIYQSFQRMVAYNRQRSTFTKTGVEDTSGYSVSLQQAYENLYGDYFPEGEAALETSVLGRFMDDLMTLPDWDPDIGYGQDAPMITDVAHNRKMLAGEIKPRYLNPAYVEDYMTKVYEPAIEDKRKVFIFVRTHPRTWLGEDMPMWVPYFCGFIDSYSPVYDPKQEFYSEITLNLQSPSSFLADSQFRQNFILINWLGQFGDSKNSELAHNIMQVHEQMGNMETPIFHQYLKDAWAGKNLREIVHQIASLANSSRTFCGFKLLQSNSAEYFKQAQAQEKIFTQEVKREDFHLYDFVYAPYKDAPVTDGVKDLNNILPSVGVSEIEISDTYPGITVENLPPNLQPEKSDKHFLYEYYPIAEGDTEPSPYLWKLKGYYPLVENLDTIIDFFKTCEDLALLGKAWWYGVEDPTTGTFIGPIRDQLSSRILIDELLDSREIFAKVLRSEFRLEDTGARTSLYDKLTDALSRIGASVCDDAMGNLCIFQNRYDSIPTRYNLGELVTSGTCFFDMLLGENPTSTYLFGDHDNRYILGNSGLLSVNPKFNSGSVATLASAVGEMNFISMPSYITQQELTGYSGADFLTQTKYGSRVFQVNQPILFKGLTNSVEYNSYTSKEILTLFAQAALRVQNAKAQTANITVNTGGLWLQPGRPVFLPSLQKKGYITNLSDSYIRGDASSIAVAVTLQNFNDFGFILGNPWLTIRAYDPNFLDNLKEVQSQEPRPFDPAALDEEGTEVSSTPDGATARLKTHYNEMQELQSNWVSLSSDSTRFSTWIIPTLGTEKFPYAATGISGPTPMIRSELFTQLQDFYDAIKDELQAYVDENQNDLGSYELVEKPIPIFLAFSPPGHTKEVGDYYDINGIVDSNKASGSSHWGGSAVYLHWYSLIDNTLADAALHVTLDGEPVYSLPEARLRDIASNIGLVPYDSIPGHYSYAGASQPEGGGSVGELIRKKLAGDDPEFVCLMLAIAQSESTMGADVNAVTNPPDSYGSLGLYQLTVADIGEKKATWGGYEWEYQTTYNLPAEGGCTFAYTGGTLVSDFGEGPVATRRIYQWADDPRLDNARSTVYAGNKIRRLYNSYKAKYENQTEDNYAESMDDVLFMTAVAYNAGPGLIGDYGNERSDGIKGIPPNNPTWQGVNPYPEKIKKFYPMFGGVFERSY